MSDQDKLYIQQNFLTLNGNEKLPQDILNTFPWIQLKRNVIIEDSIIFCGLCKKHSADLHIQEKNWDRIVHGIKLDQRKPSDYSHILSRHEGGDQHTRVIEYLKKKAKNEVLNDPIGLKMRSESKNCDANSPYVVTNRMMLTGID